MAVDDTRSAEIRRILRFQRGRYPALRGRPGYAELERICHAEGITIVHDGRLPTAGALVEFMGNWSLFLSTKLAWSLTPMTILHELAHRWCHVPGDPLFTTSIDEDPREEEADYLVSLVYGPHYLIFPVADLLPDERGRFLA